MVYRKESQFHLDVRQKTVRTGLSLYANLLTVCPSSVSCSAKEKQATVNLVG
ncbi:hypothetical protein CANCADRAFT_32473 [Tortispora caseinolytica NRRL Y-17796]|uniref:Uncharacterized protein n=1 Tax=Tortispora caseinolytica NRRL Y-17796 TaxID=767744 RepID=A0A1E4TBI6_9ASCO|nr:hypothetical protein CANCADRAFT_32473 [Tortispora caseinolytica NRRL Y-17796]